MAFEIEERLPEELERPLKEAVCRANLAWSKTGGKDGKEIDFAQLDNLLRAEHNLSRLQKHLILANTYLDRARVWFWQRSLLEKVCDCGIASREGSTAAYQWFAYQLEIAIDRLEGRNAIGWNYVFSRIIPPDRSVKELERRRTLCKEAMLDLLAVPKLLRPSLK